MCLELALQNIPFKRQPKIEVKFKGHIVGESRLDLLVGDSLILELKAIESFAPIHTAQVISYLKTTGFPLALLINFNVSVLKEGIKRVVLS